jgi:hypothetical protein
MFIEPDMSIMNTKRIEDKLVPKKSGLTGFAVDCSAGPEEPEGSDSCLRQ